MKANSIAARVLGIMLGIALALLCSGARADTPISLYRSFAGNVNFTGTEATIRNSGTNMCSVIKKNTTVTKTVSTVPAGATVQAAYLYWAGSGAAADFTVSFENKTINAQRQYTGSVVNGATTYFFSGVADVTTIVKAKSANGNGSYSFGGLTVDTSTNYCSTETVLGGFALLIVYSDPAQPFRVLNMYEGFQSIRNSSVTLNLANFRVPSPLGTASGRVGHITWEGDQALTQGGENLTFNGVVLSDANNPSGNQFNSISNIDGDTLSYGIDFDAYTIGDPTIKAGDTTATSTYSSGQDLVWLNVELIAVPNVPTADLGVAIVRTGEPVAGGAVKYALTVNNNGPDNDPGPITVVNTLPPGMSYSSVSGTGWSCTTSGVAATCTSTATSSSAPLNPGQALPVITVNALVSLSSTATTYTNTATVTGSRFDNYSTNNTATDTSTDSSTLGTGYVFTDAACAVGYAIGATGSNCHRFTGPYTANGTSPNIYITTIQNGLTVALKKSGAAQTVSIRFSLTCVNPAATAGVSAQYAGQTLQCYPGTVPPTGNAAWSPLISISFAAGSSSGVVTSTGAVPTFSYKDVGLVQLNLKDSGGVIDSTRFVSAPESVTFAALTNAVTNGGANPQGLNGFAKAGEPFYASVKVSMANNGGFPPNFGNESAPYGAVGVTIGTPDTSLVTATAGALSGGLYPVTVKYAKLGNVSLTALIAGKDGSYPAGTYFGVAVTTDTKTVGYFYPAYFETIPESGMLCTARMQCPVGALASGENVTVSGAMYSSQPFALDVRARSLDDKDVTDNLADLGSLAPTSSVSLAPFNQPGPTGTALSFGSGSFKLTDVFLNATTTVSPKLTLTLPVPFNASVQRAAWSAPAPAYIRASMSVPRVTSTGTAPDIITSLRAAGKSKEGGVELINGRMLVASASGSELLKLPLNLYSQYWTGVVPGVPNGSWDNLPGDDSTVVPAALSFTTCQKNLVGGGAAPNNCNAAVLALQTTGTVTMSGGHSLLTLKPSGAGNTGSAMVKVTGAPAWLPSTVGQIAFGVYKSRLIYIREVY
jgi:hypothetical protein